MNNLQASALATRLAKAAMEPVDLGEYIEGCYGVEGKMREAMEPILHAQAVEDENSGTSMNPISLKIRGLQSENAALRALVGRMKTALVRTSTAVNAGFGKPQRDHIVKEARQAIEEADKVTAP